MSILSVCSLISGEHSASARVIQVNQTLASVGHEVDFIQCGRRATSLRLGSRNLEIPGAKSALLLAPYPLIPFKIWKKIKYSRYRLVLGNGHFGTFYLTLAVRNRIPIFFDMHGGLPEEVMFSYDMAKNPSWRYIPRFLIYGLEKIIDMIDISTVSRINCVSRYMMDYLHEAKRVPREKLVYFPNAIDLEFFKPSAGINSQLREKLGLRNKLVFGYIGDTQMWQGLDNFIEATGSFRKRGICFLLIGGRENRREGDVIHLPRIPRSLVPDYYDLCDVLVLPRPKHPATEIAAPTKFAEYSAMGKPVLTTNVGDAARLVRQYDFGIVVEDNRPVTLARGIAEFAEFSGARLRAMGLNARHCAEREFDINRTAEEFKKSVRELLT